MQCCHNSGWRKQQVDGVPRRIDKQRQTSASGPTPPPSSPYADVATSSSTFSAFFHCLGNKAAAPLLPPFPLPAPHFVSPLHCSSRTLPLNVCRASKPGCGLSSNARRGACHCPQAAPAASGCHQGLTPMVAAPPRVQE